MRYVYLFALLLCLLLAGCAARPPAGPAPEAETLSPAAPTESAVTEAPTEASTEAPTEAVPEADVDLVGLDPYSTFDAVFEIMDNAEDYVGQRIRMQGVFDIYEYPDHVVYGCIIPDPTDNCRQQGMEFVLREDQQPAFYPNVGDEIIVSGEFALYQAGDFTFCHLIDAELEAPEE